MEQKTEFLRSEQIDRMRTFELNRKEHVLHSCAALQCYIQASTLNIARNQVVAKSDVRLHRPPDELVPLKPNTRFTPVYTCSPYLIPVVHIDKQ